jgi:hypothetical protein
MTQNYPWKNLTLGFSVGGFLIRILSPLETNFGVKQSAGATSAIILERGCAIVTDANDFGSTRLC